MKFEKLFKCTSCDKSFTESHSLQNHIKSIEKYFKCGLCCKSYMHLRQIKNHIKKFHEGEYRKPEDDPQIIDLIDEEDIIIVKKEKYYRSKSVHDNLNNETDFEFEKYDNAVARSTHFPNSEKQETKNETSKHAKNLENKDRLKNLLVLFLKKREKITFVKPAAKNSRENLFLKVIMYLIMSYKVAKNLQGTKNSYVQLVIWHLHNLNI